MNYDLNDAASRLALAEFYQRTLLEFLTSLLRLSRGWFANHARHLCFG